MSKERQAIIDMIRESVLAFESKYYRKPAYIELSAAEYELFLGFADEELNRSSASTGRVVVPADRYMIDGVPVFQGSPGVSTREGFGLRSDDLYTFEALPLADARFVQAEVEGKADNR